MTEYCYLLQRWNGGAAAAASSDLQLWLHWGSAEWSESSGLRRLLPPMCLCYSPVPTCMNAPVVLQVSSGGELLATVLLLADERLLAVVSPHVNLQPLQHVEALPAALRAAPEHSVVPWRRDNQTEERKNKKKRGSVSAEHRIHLNQPTTGSSGATTNRFPTLVLIDLQQCFMRPRSDSSCFHRLFVVEADCVSTPLTRLLFWKGQAHVTWYHFDFTESKLI